MQANHSIEKYDWNRKTFETNDTSSLRVLQRLNFNADLTVTLLDPNDASQATAELVMHIAPG